MVLNYYKLSDEAQNPYHIWLKMIHLFSVSLDSRHHICICHICIYNKHKIQDDDKNNLGCPLTTFVVFIHPMAYCLEEFVSKGDPQDWFDPKRMGRNHSKDQWLSSQGPHLTIILFFYHSCQCELLVSAHHYLPKTIRKGGVIMLILCSYYYDLIVCS